VDYEFENDPTEEYHEGDHHHCPHLQCSRTMQPRRVTAAFSGSQPSLTTLSAFVNQHPQQAGNCCLSSVSVGLCRSACLPYFD